MASAKLQITVVSASNLYNADGILAGKSDPYVIVEVPGQESMKFKTNVINNDLNPVWNFTGEIEGFMDGDLLQFTVMDSDTWPKADTPLGKATLTAQDFYPEGFHAEVPLAESKTNATLTIMIVVLGSTEVPNMMVEEGGAMQGELMQGEVMQAGAEEVGYMGAMEEVPAGVGTGPPQTLLVNVMNARGLYNADGFLAGKSDPYCICLIPGKKKSQFTTPTVNNCLDPDWNFTGKIQDFEAGDSLEFQVWDADTFPKPDQLLGKVTLSPQDFDAHPDGLTGVLQLIGGKSQELGTLEVCIQVDLHGEVVTGAETELTAQEAGEAQYTGASGQAEQAGLSQQVAAEAGRPLGNVNPHLAGAKMAKLKVTVYRAHNLYNADGFLAGKSDPYVICMVQDSGHQHGHQHGKKERKFQTKVIKNDLEPQWNHLGIINGYMEGEVLEFQVWDKDTFPKPDDLLGKVSLNSTDFFPMGLEGEVTLNDTKGGQESTITIRIECVPDTEATGLSAPRTSVATPVKRISQGGVTYVTGGQGYHPSGQVTYSAGGYPGAQYSTPGATYTMPGQPVPSVTYTSGQPTAYSVGQPATYSMGQPTVMPSSPVNYNTGAPVTYASPTTAFTSGAPVTTYSASPMPAGGPIYTSSMPMQAIPMPATMPAAMPAVTYAAPAMPQQAPPTTYTAAPAQPSYQVMPSTYTASPPSFTAASSSAPMPTVTAPATTYAASSMVPTPYTAEPQPTPVTYSAAPATTYEPQPTPVTYSAAPATTYSVPATSYKMPTPTAVACGAPQVQMMAPQPVQMAPQPVIQMQPMQMQPQPMPTQQVQMGLPQYGVSAPPIMPGSQVMCQGGCQQPGAPAPNVVQGLFEMLDTNHDGVITRSEFANATQRIH